MAFKSKKKQKNNAEDIDNTSEEVEAQEYTEQPSEKKEKKSKKKKQKKDGKKSKFPLFLILILLGAGALTLILVFNIGNLRDKYIMPAMQNVPIIKNIIPQSEQQQDEFSGLSKDELVAQIKALTEDNEKLENNNTEINNKLNDANKEITRLKEIEAQQLEFKQDKETFDSMIALNDPQAYQTFYEKIFPENADKLYKEVVGAAQNDKNLKNYVKTFENMKKDAAAAVFKEMLRTDMDLVVQILENISNEQRGDILSAMEPKDAAAVVKRLAPQQNNTTNN